MTKQKERYHFLLSDIENFLRYHIWNIACITENRERKKRKYKLQVKFFLPFFLHHLIEHELWITKIYFLVLANTFFQSQKKEKLEMCKIFYFICFFRFSIKNWMQTSCEIDSRPRIVFMSQILYLILFIRPLLVTRYGSFFLCWKKSLLPNFDQNN
jgi:hypothetical protein